MILMWLGPFIFTMFGLAAFRSCLSRCLPGMQRKFLSLPEPILNFKMLVISKWCNLSHGSFLQSQYSSVALLNTRASSRRYALVLLCLSVAGTWTTMLGILLAWQVGGEIPIVASFVLLLWLRWRRKSLLPSYVLMGLGAYLSGMHWLMEKQSILMTLMGESDFHFMLADGRLPAQLLWLAVAFIITAILNVESWAVVLALVLFAAGSLSLNGAVAMIIGEMLAHVWMLWWRSRQLNQDTRALTKGYAIANTVGLLIAFFVAGYIRDIFAFNVSFDVSQLTEKSLQFFVMYFVIVVIQSLTTMTWGHFAAQKKLDEVQRGEYFPITWIDRDLISSGILDFILKKLHERLELLIAQKKELDSKDRAQIPAAFLKDHEHEITQLALWLPLAAESLNKRKI